MNDTLKKFLTVGSQNKFLRQEPWLDAPARTSGVARRSWRKNVVNFHSTTII